tara:strand:+ start:558 stop:1028 length:471 start_codon:yes stop_codon:yes gene_type:complete
MKILSSLILLMWAGSLMASPLIFNFHSPSFSGIGQSSHYLTIENLEKSRRDSIIAKAKAEADLLEYELENTAIELFRKNLESRFYTALAKNIIDQVFGTAGNQQNSGETTIDGYDIVWTSTEENDDADGVTVTIKDAAGNTIYTYGMPYQEETASE